jgi:hypothetical protein
MRSDDCLDPPLIPPEGRLGLEEGRELVEGLDGRVEGRELVEGLDGRVEGRAAGRELGLLVALPALGRA